MRLIHVGRATYAQNISFISTTRAVKIKYNPSSNEVFWVMDSPDSTLLFVLLYVRILRIDSTLDSGNDRCVQQS